MIADKLIYTKATTEHSGISTNERKIEMTEPSDMKSTTVEQVGANERRRKDLTATMDGNITFSTDAVPIKLWFHSLDYKERSVVASFSDQTFLDTLLSFAAPRNSDTFGNGAGAWEAMISLDDFEAKYDLYRNGQQKTPKLTNRTGSSEGTLEKNSERVASEDQTVLKYGAKKDIGFRIQERLAADVAVVAPPPPIPSSLITGVDDRTMSCVIKIFDNLAIVSPSAVKHVIKNAETPLGPTMILRPTFFAGDASEETLFSALESNVARQILYNDESSTNKKDTESLWWLRRMSGHDTNVQYVPLFTLLLARLAREINQSFLIQKNEADMEANTGGNFSARSKGFLLEVFSFCRALDDIATTMDSDTLSDFQAPLAEFCGRSERRLSPNDANIVNVIIIPFPWIVSMCERQNPGDFIMLDKAVALSLQNMVNIEIKADTDVSSLKSTESNPTVTPVSKEVVATSVTSSNKKKKKKKKRKGKKILDETDEIYQGQKAAISNYSTELPASNKNEVISEQMTLKDTIEKAEEKTRSDSISSDSVNSEDSDPFSNPAPLKLTELFGNKEKGGGFAIDVPLSSSSSVHSSQLANKCESTATQSDIQKDEDDDVWETVEVRGRGNRRKSSDRLSLGGLRHSHSSPLSGSNDFLGGNNKKSKHSRTGKTWNKSSTKKIVRDILYSVIDNVEEEVRTKKPPIPSPSKNVSGNPWRNGPPGSSKQTPLLPAMTAPALRKDFASIVAGKPSQDHTLCDTPSEQAQPITGVSRIVSRLPDRANEYSKAARVSPSKLPPSLSKQPFNDYSSKNSPGKRVKKTAVASVDQNTATTYQETVSAVSVVSNTRFDSIKNAEVVQDQESVVSSGGPDEAPKNEEQVVSEKTGSQTPNPPLQTLLGPDSGNSATSSVASSLEAPHAAHPHRRSATAVDVNDVGYHLLDICDKLSRDMSLFMNRRTLALSTRRRERGALLIALQDCVSAIWPNLGHVEPYGSCATLLDLPASDLDVVVRGLDRNVDVMGSMHSIPSSVSGSKSDGTDIVGVNISFDENEEAHHHQRFAASYGMIPTHRNGERVMRLAADIEKQPWAVQVNAIPTASVPVIKILCDPSRLSNNSQVDWMAHAHSLPIEAANIIPQGAPQIDPEQGAYPQATLLPWRGSDVMKGLLMLDVTFEGPEHGGIGSTEYTIQAVEDACIETGLRADHTPFVQTVMVLKELLSQRKLNEPYSGGLSSYALLLLVVALMKERAVIREEIEHVERQRQAMAAAELDATDSLTYEPSSPNRVVSTSSNFDSISLQNHQVEKVFVSTDHNGPSKQARPHTHRCDNKGKTKEKIDAITKSEAVQESDNPPSSSSSWVSIAKRSATSKQAIVTDQSDLDDIVDKEHHIEKKTLFVDALIKDSPQKMSLSNDISAASTVIAQSTQVKKSQVNDNDKDISSNVQIKKGEISKDEKPHTPQLSKSPRNIKANVYSPKGKISTALSDKSYTNDTKILDVQIPTSLPRGRAPQDATDLHVSPPFYPQGYNDIVEVLCSGGTTAGKLLMHFLLYYGQHFDAQSTAIDISGKHEREIYDPSSLYPYFSPYIQRRTPGSIDPITGMLIVDPIVIYDPLEGSEHKNVARRCFAWNSVRWIFAQSYATLASAVERSATPPATPCGTASSDTNSQSLDREAIMFDADAIGDLMDPSSPLLRCLLSF